MPKQPRVRTFMDTQVPGTLLKFARQYSCSFWLLSFNT